MRPIDVFREELPTYLSELRRLVELETPTGDLARLATAAAHVRDLLAPHGPIEVTETPHGPLVRLHRPGRGGRVLLLAHLDTVWPVGSWPVLWHVENGRARGPGVYDMKAGLLFLPWMLRAGDRLGLALPELDILVTPDEETGSRSSRPLIEAAARAADAALVLEPTVPGGPVKVARKGSGEYVLTVRGRAAHQGVAPESGANAVIEAAHQILAALALARPEEGTTVGPNVVSGGVASNVVPDHAEIRIDVRVWTAQEQQRLAVAMAALAPRVAGCRLELAGGWNRPPMETSPASLALQRRAAEIGRPLGQSCEPVSWGGSSDANLTAALGTPTLDGLGPIGGGAHEPDEHIEIDQLPPRLALLTELVSSLAAMPIERTSV